MRLIATTILILIISSFIYAQTHSVSAVINGSNEVPSNGSMGLGTLTGSFDSTSNMLTINATYFNMDGTLTASHLHNAPAGSNGGVIVNLNPTTDMNSGNISGTFSIPSANETELLNGDVYINLHSSAFGGGELRGQLALSPIAIESEVELTTGDLFIESNKHGIILKSSSGKYFRVQVGDDGKLISTAVTNP